MSMTVKAYLDHGTEDPEIRRFAVDQSVSASLPYLKGKIQHVFPSLNSKQYKLFWKDADSDLVSFSSDDELTEALGYVQDGVFRVYIKREGDQSSGVLHNGVVCDGCEKQIRGVRYKCVNCPDYDLCRHCELQGKHNQHDMLRICTPRMGGMPFMFPFMPGVPPHGPHPPPPPPPPPPHGADGCSEGGPWGKHPWRRMMKRCWRRMMREQWGAPDFFGAYNQDPSASRDSSVDSTKTAKSAETEASGCGKQESQEGEGDRSGDCREDYLKNMGDSVAAMLDPLGIDVHVDIEHNGQKHHVHGGGRARGRGGCRGRGGRGGRGGHWRGPWNMFPGPWGFDLQGSPWGSRHQQNQQQPEVNKPTDNDQEMHQDNDEPGTSKAQDMSVGSPAPGSDEGADWTVVGNEKEEQMKSDDFSMGEPGADVATDDQPEAQVVNPSLAQVPFNPHIADALAQMKAMGYDDEGGWLSRLLEAKNGNINLVLDSLQPKPQ